MKNVLLTILRNKETDRSTFREATHKLGLILANEASKFLEREKVRIKTPIAQAEGVKLKNRIVLIPILRSGLALLPSFLDFFPDAKVGMLGLRRDEVTAAADLYYHHLPQMGKEEEVLILEPMIATGNTIVKVLDLLKRQKIKENKITICSIIAAPESILQLKKHGPSVRLILIKGDKRLNKDNFIVPGLGDFGDRYFGTET